MAISIPNLVDAVVSMRQNEARRYPCKSNRASGLGYAVPELNGCLRRGVYDRTRWDERELFDAAALLRFAEGNRQEQAVLDDLKSAGHPLIEQQTPYEWKPYNITGHLDGKLVVDGVAVPVEIKSCSPFVFDTISDWESLNGKPWLRAYKAQITLYELMQGIDVGVMLFKDKSSGMLKQLVVPLDYELGEYCIRTAEAINKHVDAGTEPPECEDKQVCKDCPFRHLCHPTIDFGVPLKVADDPLFGKRVARMLELENAAGEYEDVKKLVREQAKATAAANGDLNLVVDKWKLEGKQSGRG